MFEHSVMSTDQCLIRTWCFMILVIVFTVSLQEHPDFS